MNSNEQPPETRPLIPVRTPPAYRLPTGLELGRVKLQVADLERSLAWYGTVLGFTVTDSDGKRALLSAHGDSAPLVELHEQPGAAPVPPRGRPGLYHFALLLPDRAALGRFVSHLARLGARAGASDHLVSEALYLSDPDGLGIEVYADRPLSDWRLQGDNVRMGTLPLDLADLVEAAGGEPWTGLPAGTRMGHLHLQVGNLKEAEAFYHEALGFDATVWDFPGALFLSAGGYHHHLGLNTWAGSTPPAGAGDARLLEWELRLPEVEDVQAAAASLKAAGYSPEREGDSAIVIADPWGTRLRLSGG